jgi:hypothetical protein
MNKIEMFITTNDSQKLIIENIPAPNLGFKFKRDKDYEEMIFVMTQSKMFDILNREWKHILG